MLLSWFFSVFHFVFWNVVSFRKHFHFLLLFVVSFSFLVSRSDVRQCPLFPSFSVHVLLFCFVFYIVSFVFECVLVFFLQFVFSMFFKLFMGLLCRRLVAQSRSNRHQCWSDCSQKKIIKNSSTSPLKQHAKKKINALKLLNFKNVTLNVQKVVHALLSTF